ncbi:MAG: electron transfer flavoprotein subunit alpha/FixB family protein [Gaiellaceae bacterium]
MKALVFLEQHGSELTRDSLGVLSKAASLADETVGVVAGSAAREAAAFAGRYGATGVLLADDPALTAPLPQPRVDLLARIVRERNFDTVLLGQSVLAADLAAGLAARLECGLNWDLVDVMREGENLVGKRPALADSVEAEVTWRDLPRIALFRSGALEPVETGGEAELEEIALEFEDFSTLAVMLEQAHEERGGPDIEDADVVVAGGRGVGRAEDLTLVEGLAQALGGAVGVTRAVVDAGWYPYAAQIGQTGRTVAPRLYIACGISGAIQHKVGMQRSGTVVAINKDERAPIFEYADLAVVGDLHEIVPQLTELVRARKGNG